MKYNFIIFIFMIVGFGISNAQTEIKLDTLHKKTVVDTISFDNIIKNDSIPQDSINSDSAKVKIVRKNMVSPDAIDQTIEYACEDSMLFSMKEKKIYLYKSASLKTTELNLKSGYVEISLNENYLFAEGLKNDSTGKIDEKPEFEQGEEKFNAKNIKYNFKSKKGLVRDVKSEYNQGFLLTSKSKIYPDKQVHIYDGKYTTCDLDQPHFYIELTKAKVIPGKTVVSGPMYFVIADIPLKFIGLPFGFIPTQKQNSKGILIPEYGEEQQRGFFLRNAGYYIPINDYVNASITGDIYSKGSWGLGVKTDFKWRYHLNGNMSVKYNVNKIGEKVLPNYQENKTYWINAAINQDGKFNPNSTFSASVNFGSSGHGKYNAKTIEQYTNTTTSSSISYRRNKPGAMFNFSANINETLNSQTQKLSLSMPTIAFNMKRQFPFKNMGTGTKHWYQKISVGFNSSFKNTVNVIDTMLFTSYALTQMKNGAKYTIPISTSFKLLKHITVSPSFNYTGRIYSNYIEKRIIQMPDENDILANKVVVDTINGINHPFDYNFSMPFSTRWYGMYTFNKGKITALRHVFAPSISFNYRPDFSRGFWNTHNYNYYNPDPDDEEYENSMYSYYEYGIFGRPPSGKSGSIGVNFGNNFEIKVKNPKDTVSGTKKIKLLENLSFGTSYNIAADSLNWSNISMRGNTKLYKNISLTFSSSFDPYVKDSLGRKINKFEWTENKRIAHLVNARMSMNASLNPEMFKDKNGKKNASKKSYMYNNPDIPYDDFNLKWNLTMGYNFTLNNTFNTDLQAYEPQIIQTLSTNGRVNLTKNWRVTTRIDYDFTNQKFSYSSIDIYRDLHCWEMSLFVIPFGALKSYNFRINIKSSVFQGVEYKKTKSWHDNFD